MSCDMPLFHVTYHSCHVTCLLWCHVISAVCFPLFPALHEAANLECGAGEGARPSAAGPRAGEQVGRYSKGQGDPHSCQGRGGGQTAGTGTHMDMHCQAAGDYECTNTPSPPPPPFSLDFSEGCQADEAAQSHLSRSE